VAGAPDPKSRSLARGTRRYRRKVASPKQWQAIIAAKLGPCRVCVSPPTNGGLRVQPTPVEFHHLVSRARGGDDTPDNIVPLCSEHHDSVTLGDLDVISALAASLSDAERAYVESRAAR
jgi:5-methylcytosine-specific restriction endonuclease McrA